MKKKTKEGYGLPEHIFNVRKGLPPETVEVEDPKPYNRKGVTWLRPWVQGESSLGISISDADRENGSPKIGDMIATNPDDENDQWLVAEKYFKDNYQSKEDEGVYVSKRQLDVAEEVMIHILNDNGALNRQEPYRLDKAFQLIIANDCKGITFDQAIEIMLDEKSSLGASTNLYWESIQ